MSYEWAMTPIEGIRISSDNKGINAYCEDKSVSISWKQVFDAINLYRDDIMADIKLKELMRVEHLVV